MNICYMVNMEKIVELEKKLAVKNTIFRHLGTDGNFWT